MAKKTMYFPECLSWNILSKLPLSSLARLRSTCKTWNVLIKDIVKNKSLTLMMLIDSKVYLVNIDLHEIPNNIVKVTKQLALKDPLSKEVDIRHVYLCDGLLLCSTKDNRLLVWNPFLGETKWIQPKNTYKRFDYYSLGKSSCNEYKILRIDQSRYMSPCLVIYEVYDFTSNSWRIIGNTRDWYIPRIRGRGTYLKGNTYWLAYSQNDDIKYDFLLSFDFSAERFGTVALPGDNDFLGLSVTREEQQLCLLAFRNVEVRDIDVWIATEIATHGAASWIKMFTVKGEVFDRSFMFCNGMNFLFDRKDKVLVCPGKHWKFWNSHSFLHIVVEDKYIQVDHHDVGSRCSLLFEYVPSLVKIQQNSIT